MLDPRAIALQGIGFQPRAVLSIGYFDLEITVEPIGNPGSGGGYAERPPEEKVRLTFTVTVRGNKHVKSYIVTEHAGMQLLNKIKLMKKAVAKVTVSISAVTNLLQKAKHALASVNINMMRKKND
jgi:hypothetical protein